MNRQADDPCHPGGDPAGPAWAGLTWGAWVPFGDVAAFRALPSGPGVYRVRAAGDAGLAYVGQTARSLRERLGALRRHAMGALPPYNDPHTAAPHLWLLRTESGACLECSCTPVVATGPALRGLEDMLLWRHRLSTGRSTLANHGWFFPGYRRPTNRVVRRGATVGPGTPLRADPGAPGREGSLPALWGDFPVPDAPWWLRAPLDLGGVAGLPAGPAVYVIHDIRDANLLYVGETLGLRGRAATHAASRSPVSPRIPPTCHFWPAGRSPRFASRDATRWGGLGAGRRGAAMPVPDQAGRPFS